MTSPNEERKKRRVEAAGAKKRRETRPLTLRKLCRFLLKKFKPYLRWWSQASLDLALDRLSNFRRTRPAVPQGRRDQQLTLTCHSGLLLRRKSRSSGPHRHSKGFGSPGGCRGSYEMMAVLFPPM